MNDGRPVLTDEDYYPVDVDRENGLITICGIKYDLDLFRFYGFGSLNTDYRLISREDGVVTIETAVQRKSKRKRAFLAGP